MDTYRNGTLALFQKMYSEDFRIDEQGGYLIIQDQNATLQLPKRFELAKEILRQSMKTVRTQKEIAELCQVRTSAISNSISSKVDRKPERQLALKVILTISPLPSFDDINHMLTQLFLPRIYDSTAFLDVNQQNYLLSRIISYAQRNDCPCKNWILFAQNVFRYCEVPYLGSESAEYCIFPDSVYQELAQWKDTLSCLKTTDYMAERKVFLDRYREKYQLRSKQNALNHLYDGQDFSGPTFSWDTLNSVFSYLSNPNSKGSRSTLILVGLALQCTRDEINRMLKAVNHPILYPNCSDLQELDWCRKAEQNG